MCALKSPAFVYWTAEVQTVGKCSLSRGREEFGVTIDEERMKCVRGSSTIEPGGVQEAARAKTGVDFKSTAVTSVLFRQHDVEVYKKVK